MLNIAMLGCAHSNVSNGYYIVSVEKSLDLLARI